MASTHAKRAHAEYAPSSADRWSACVGSTQLIRSLYPKGVPNTQSHATASGTAIHEEAERWLTGPPADKATKYGITYKLDGEEHRIDYQDWVGHVEGYYDKIQEIVEELRFFTGEEPVVVVEGKIKVIDPHCWGSVDCYIYAGNTLYVIDLKTGRGHIVSAEQNRQFMTYAAGICIEHKWTFDEIHLCRFQAPDEENPFDDWVTDKVTLQSWVTNLRQIIKTSEAGKGELTSGDHCLWCPAKSQCPKQHETAMSVFDDQEAGTLAPVQAMTLEQQMFLVEHATQIIDYIRAVTDNMLQLALENPDAVPGYKVVEGRSMRRWNRSEADIAAALALEGIDTSQLYEEPKLKSFTKVEKVVGKKQFAALDLVEKPPGKPTLVPVSDKRPTLASLTMDGFND